MKSILQKCWKPAFFLWSILLMILSVLPTNSLIEKSNEASKFRWDYLEHFSVFLIFSMDYGLWRSRMIKNTRKEILIFLLIGTCFAVGTEAIQLLVEGRSFNPLDISFNMLGLLLGTTIFLVKKQSLPSPHE